MPHTSDSCSEAMQDTSDDGVAEQTTDDETNQVRPARLPSQQHERHPQQECHHHLLLSQQQEAPRLIKSFITARRFVFFLFAIDV